MPNAGLCDMHGKKFVIGDFVLCARWTEVDGGMARVGAKHGAALVASMLRFGMKCGTFPDAHGAFGFSVFQCQSATSLFSFFFQFSFLFGSRTTARSAEFPYSGSHAVAAQLTHPKD